MGWTPDEHKQAEDRTHRPGQEKSVNIYTIIGKDTIDEKIFSLLTRKERGISAVLDDGEVEFTKIDIARQIWTEYGGEVSLEDKL